MVAMAIKIFQGTKFYLLDLFESQVLKGQTTIKNYPLISPYAILTSLPSDRYRENAMKILTGMLFIHEIDN
jgi:hypothetical protein